MKGDMRNVTFLASLAVATAVGVFTTVAVWSLWIRDVPVDVISFDTQVIEELLPDGSYAIPQVEGYNKPSVMVGDDVPVRGLHCVAGNREVSAIGSMWWERLDPQGLRVLVDDDVPVVLENGCETFRYSNPMPAVVSAAVNTSGDDAQTWRITGTVTPISVNGKKVSWETETFLIVAEG
jgi:hypothetical protein